MQNQPLPSSCVKYASHDTNTVQTTVLAVPPLEVKIIGSNQPLSAGKRYELVCTTSGSRPPATVTWWRNDQRLVETKETVSNSGKTSKTVWIVREDRVGYSLVGRKSKSGLLNQWNISRIEIYTCPGKPFGRKERKKREHRWNLTLFVNRYNRP